ncbi:type I restriction enzyme EcoKI subunit R [Labrenzia sp. THAF35]|uniref:DEAD/DEAH box helicase n=1 Tax=Labrenzia sp. THAF35 TaxID=2587854 RepID=UPI0012A84075|nr:DEAD/DEAH box helicase [Labrenzia sp. THAF35]QFT69661.1 type I restriction enzyme EcoKI subunit R [Labrenzia sp. THAF35]
MDLRYYQSEGEQAVFDYWMDEDGNPLVDFATGCGKSLLAASLIKRLLDGWPDMRIMVVTHVMELIEQNYLELVGFWPMAPAGIYSAGLGRRDSRAQVIFAGIQTVWNKLEQICKHGGIDVIIVDECHTIPINDATRYGQFFKMAREITPDLKVVGLTATPYRLDSGRLDEGEDRIFDKVVYTYGVADGINDGYLAPLSSKATATELDTKGVGRLGGDFKKGDLQRAVDKTSVTSAAVDEIVAKGADKRSWLCFCSGVDHAIHVRDEIQSRGITCEAITDKTGKAERRDILAAYKNYEIRALTNNNVLTTGFNHKGVDLIAFLRPTLSLSLYVQMAGRGTRVLYAPGMPLETAEQRKAAIAAGPKPNCLVLDFAGLVDKHGPIDMVNPKEPGKGTGEAPIKICPQEEGGCGEKVHASARVCRECGFEFPINEEPKIKDHASDAPILSSTAPEPRQVTRRTFRFHEGKPGKKDSVKVTYMIGLTPIPEWVCPAHEGYAKNKADQYWKKHGGDEPCPENPLEWLERQAELKDTIEIKVRPKGRYWEVCGHTVELDVPDAQPVDWAQELEDEIPF